MILMKSVMIFSLTSRIDEDQSIISLLQSRSLDQQAEKKMNNAE